MSSIKGLDEKLVRWTALATQLDQVKADEMNLRKEITKLVFDVPKEGTSKHPLANYYVLKAVCQYSYKVDNPTYMQIKDTLAKEGVPVDDLVVYKPEVSKTVYKTLTPEQKAIFDSCLTVTPGTAQLEIVLPKR